MKTNYILKLSVIFCFSLFAKTVNAQETDYFNFNGWEFLQWSLDKEQVEDTLQNRKIPFDPGTPNQKSGPTTTFVFQNMKTILAYDMQHLYDVQQYQYFDVSEKTKADSVFAQLKETLVNQYGEPQINKYNNNDNEVQLEWELKFTKVALYFSGNDQPLEGFESQAYQIFLHTNPK